MDRVEDGVRPGDPQIGVLLTREAGERKILGSVADDRTATAGSPRAQAEVTTSATWAGMAVDRIRSRARPAISAARSESSAVMPASSSTISARSAAIVPSR